MFVGGLKPIAELAFRGRIFDGSSGGCETLLDFGFNWASNLVVDLEVNQLVPISGVTLLAKSVTGIDIFASAGKDSIPILFCSKDEPVEYSRLRKILDEGVLKLYVTSESYKAYQAYLRDHWTDILVDENLPIETRTSVLSEVLRDVLDVSFQSGDTNKIVASSKSLGAGIVKVLGNKNVLVSGLCDVLRHDYATFTHSANVACYIAMLANRLGYSTDEQNQIVVGALVHDLGKLSIDDRILSKPGKLDEFEIRAIQKHPMLGFTQLASRLDLNFGQLMMVYQHHEKLDGSGYPVAIAADEIHPWAKLCAVVDIFEALTSTRPYRSAMPHLKALSILQRESGKKLDGEIVAVWSEMVLAQGGVR